MRGELRNSFADPLGRRCIVDLRLGCEQIATELGILVGEYHPGTGLGGLQRSGETRRTATDHQHIAVHMHLVVAIRVRLGRGSAESRGMADEGFVLHPEGLRPHKGLVVKPGRKQARQQITYRTEVEADTRPAILAEGFQPLVQLNLGGTQIRLGYRAGFHLNQGIRFLAAGRQNAARAMVFKTSGNQMHAVGEQRRGERIAAEARELPAVEAKFERPITLDVTPGKQAKRLVAHLRLLAVLAFGGFSPIL